MTDEQLARAHGTDPQGTLDEIAKAKCPPCNNDCNQCRDGPVRVRRRFGVVAAMTDKDIGPIAYPPASPPPQQWVDRV